MSNSSPQESYTVGHSTRPLSEMLVDLHIFNVPPQLWQTHQNSAVSEIVPETVSAGYIRVHPESVLRDVRAEVYNQLGHDVLPRDYVFLRRVGRVFAQVKAKQEHEVKVKYFIPPQTEAPELYVLDAAVADQSVMSYRGDAITNRHQIIPAIGTTLDDDRYIVSDPYHDADVLAHVEAHHLEMNTPHAVDPHYTQNELERQRYLREVERVLVRRHDMALEREALLNRMRQLQTRSRPKPVDNEMRNLWKQRYFEEKKATGPREDNARALRDELDHLNERTVGQLEAVKDAFKGAPGGNRAEHQRRVDKVNEKIHTTRLEHDIEDLQARLQATKTRLTTESKLRTQSDYQLQMLKADQEQRTPMLKHDLAHVEPPYPGHDILIEPPIIHHRHVERVISPPAHTHAPPTHTHGELHHYRADCALCRAERPDGRPGRSRVKVAPPVVEEDEGLEDDWENSSAGGVRRYVKDSPWKAGGHERPGDKHTYRSTNGPYEYRKVALPPRSHSPANTDSTLNPPPHANRRSPRSTSLSPSPTPTPPKHHHHPPKSRSLSPPRRGVRTTGGGDGEELKRNLARSFNHFASRTGEKELLATDFDVNKWCMDAGVLGRNLTSTDVDISIAKVKARNSKYITLNDMTPLIDDMATKYKLDQQCDQGTAKNLLTDRLANSHFSHPPKVHIVKPELVQRLTDARRYTGTHKKKAFISGRRVGPHGWENRVDHVGYDNNYTNIRRAQPGIQY